MEAPPPLRIVSHNVGGVASAARACRLALLWSSLGVDVLALQETWTDRPGGATIGQLQDWLSAAAALLGQPRPLLLAHSRSTADTARAGVALLLWSARAVHSATLQHAASDAGEGRALVGRLSWEGHTLHVANAYCPSDGPTARAAFHTDTLQPILTALPPGPLLLVGDFNHTPNPALDRVPRTLAERTPEHATEALFVEHIAGPLRLVDAYRHHHPRAAGHTFRRADLAARLDRCYASRGLLPHVLGCRPHYAAVTEHSPVELLLLPAAAAQPPAARRRWRADLRFAADAEPSAEIALFAARVSAHARGMSPTALLQWWPGVQRALQSRLRVHARRYREQHPPLPADATARLREHAERLVLAAESAAPPDQPAALQAAADARAAYCTVLADQAAPMAASLRTAAVLSGEQPCPAVTRALRPPRPPAAPAALRAPSGVTETAPQRLADLLADQYAGVSRAPLTSPEAQAAVLAAVVECQLEGATRRIAPPAAETAGAAAVTEDEVRQAVRALAAGRAPGPDGLPAEVWKHWAGDWAPALAALFSAVGSTGRLPSGFHAGLVVPIYKGGDADAAAAPSYRPITLLAALYKVLARVLCARFCRALSDVLGVEQSAFLPGRSAADAILLSQLLPAALSSEDSSGAVVLVDFAKAFDTIDRPFLLQLMRSLGAGEGMCRWVAVLLSRTVARVTVHGSSSCLRTWHAGVRQGCPLSPVLYLFVAEGLRCWLWRRPGLGVVLAGARLVSSQFADDTKVCVPDLSPATGAALQSALQVFHEATGQGTNVPKSAAVPVGVVPPELPADVGGVRVVPAASSLGVDVSNAPFHWFPARRAGLRPLRVGLPLPGQPAPAAASAAWRARLDSACGLARRIGCLPLSMFGRARALSAYAYGRCLFHAEFSQPPAGALAALSRAAAAAVDGPAALPGVSSALLCGAVRAGGFGLLPLEQHICARHAVHACRLLAFLVGALPPARCHPWMSLAALLLSRLAPALHPAQFLLAACVAPRADVARGVVLPAPLQEAFVPEGPLLRMVLALHALGAPAWSGDAVPRAPLSAWVCDPSVRGSVPHAVAALRWSAPAVGGAQALSLPVAASLSVSCFTRLLQVPVAQSRDRAMLAYVSQAGGEHTHDPLARLRFCLAALLRVPWASHHKEILWRLAVNGVPAAGGGGICFAAPCRCGAAVCPAGARDSSVHRLHAFWSCPVAQAVCGVLRAGLPGLSVERRHVWLLESPSPVVNAVLWRVIALSALNAMHEGRRVLWRPGGLVPEAVRAAVCKFWLLLLDFVAVGQACVLTLPTVGPAHPFLAVREGRVVVRYS